MKEEKEFQKLKVISTKPNLQFDEQEGQNVNYRTRRNSQSPVTMELHSRHQVLL